MPGNGHRRLKVAHVITLLELGGAQRNTLYTVGHLDKTRFDPVLVCGRGAILDEETSALGVPVRYVPSLGRTAHPWKDPLALAALVRIFRRERPDIVHTHSSKAGILGRLAARAAGVPVIVHTFHGFGFTPNQKRPIRGFYVLLERLAARVTTAFIAVSRANMEEALARGIGRRDRFHLIRSGIRLGDYRSLARDRDLTLGLRLAPGLPLVTTVGPFKPQKNLGDFLDAAALVQRERPDARFLIVGDGQGRPALEEKRRRLGLEKCVFMPGWRRDIPDILRRTAVFVLTSLWEGLPRSLVEAMAAGVPSVVNGVDGCLDVVRDGRNGFLAPPGRPDLTAAKILALLRDPAAAGLVGERARASIGDEFDMDGMVRAQEELYERLCRLSLSPSGRGLL
jgi:glycosyltransferase involved in cell wall biosynthesis